MLVKVEDKPGFARDTNSGAILNINSTRAEMARQKKAEKKNQRQEMNDLKSEVADIKNILNKLIEKL